MKSSAVLRGLVKIAHSMSSEPSQLCMTVLQEIMCNSCLSCLNFMLLLLFFFIASGLHFAVSRTNYSESLIATDKEPYKFSTSSETFKLNCQRKIHTSTSSPNLLCSFKLNFFCCCIGWFKRTSASASAHNLHTFGRWLSW